MLVSLRLRDEEDKSRRNPLAVQIMVRRGLQSGCGGS